MALSLASDLVETMTDIEKLWDVVVVGSGPAGSVAAHQMAQRGMCVLLVDKARFPRAKACGGCLNPSALNTLDRIGLGSQIRRSSAGPIRRIQIHTPYGGATFALPGGVSISRRALDVALIKAAIDQGVTFKDHTMASLRSVEPGFRTLLLQHKEQIQVVRTKLVLAASGLAGRLLDREQGLGSIISRRARIGVAAVMNRDASFDEEGTIYMACGRGGYVGVVRLENNRLNVAASLDPRFVRTAQGPQGATVQILCQSGLPPIHGSDQTQWLGTGALTRKRCVAAYRLLVIGDAAGYVEPFTGEGMAWALNSAVAVAPIAKQAVRRWKETLQYDWSRWHRDHIDRRQRACRLMTAVLRRPLITHLTLQLLNRTPRVAQTAIDMICSPPAAQVTGTSQWA